MNCVAPGFIATAMTDKLNEDQKGRILGAIPAGRYEYRLQLIPADATEPSRTLTGEVTLAAYKPLNLPTTERGGTPATVLQWPMPPSGATTILMMLGLFTRLYG